MGIFHDGANGDGELLMTVAALQGGGSGGATLRVTV
jgi:hypothetical protein